MEWFWALLIGAGAGGLVPLGVEVGRRLGAATILFVGDDVTDEDAFGQLSPTDIAIKVGDADTMAPHRFRDPAAVLAFLRSLQVSS